LKLASRQSAIINQEPANRRPKIDSRCYCPKKHLVENMEAREKVGSR